jgi:hypothetical protein
MRSLLLPMILLVAVPAAAQESTTTVRVDYMALTSRGSANWTVRGKLFADGKIEEALDGTSGRERMAMSSNQRLGARWRVVAENKLQRLYEYPNHFQIIDVEVDGKKCSAKMSTELKPGKTEYLVLGVNTGLIKVNKPEYADVRCTIE